MFILADNFYTLSFNFMEEYMKRSKMILTAGIAVLLATIILYGCSNGNEDDSPGESSLIGKVVINEVYTYGDQSSIDDLDWVELYNTTGNEIDLGGLLIWESNGKDEAWTVPTGSKIGPNALLIFECDKDGLTGDSVNYMPWGLSKGPEEYVVLAYADMTEIDRVKLPSLNENESYGRINNGASEWQIFAQFTKETANTGSARAVHNNTTGIWVNEVYHDNTNVVLDLGWDTTTDFIELYNSNDFAVNVSGWEMLDDSNKAEEEKFVIPSETIIPAKGFLVYDVYKNNTEGPLFGLGVGGDWIHLYKPGATPGAIRELADKIEIPGFTKESGLRDKGYTFGRYTDGSSQLTFFTEASKGSSNNGKKILELD
jgi:hypothetical protein